MSNMSYCRFENTSRDLDDCKNALEELTNGNGEALSDRELTAAKQLARTCLDVVMMLVEYTGRELEDLAEIQDPASDLADAVEEANNQLEGA